MSSIQIVYGFIILLFVIAAAVVLIRTRKQICESALKAYKNKTGMIYKTVEIILVSTFLYVFYYFFLMFSVAFIALGIGLLMIPVIIISTPVFIWLVAIKHKKNWVLYMSCMLVWSLVTWNILQLPLFGQTTIGAMVFDLITS